MSKFSVKDLWNERYGKQEDVYDYAGRLMKKSACGNPNSSYQPTIDHIRPLADGGKDVKIISQSVIMRRIRTKEIPSLIGEVTVNGIMPKRLKTHIMDMKLLKRGK